MLLREMQEEDLDEIERLEGLLFTPAWSKEDFLHELKQMIMLIIMFL